MFIRLINTLIICTIIIKYDSYNIKHWVITRIEGNEEFSAMSNEESMYGH